MPSPNTQKLNYDAAFDILESKVGLGVLIWNESMILVMVETEFGG